MEGFTKKEAEEFKRLISKYCKTRICQNKCTDDDCEFCVIDSAYTEIAEELFKDEDSVKG